MKSLVRCVWVLFFILFLQDIYAVVARPGVTQFKLPDGRSLEIKNNGDEFFNWVTTVDGYRLMMDQDGFFVYASSLKSGSLVPSNIRASNVEKRSVEEVAFLNSVSKNIGLKEQLSLVKKSNTSKLKSKPTDFPSLGVRKNILILATFSDRSPSFTQTDFNNLMNQPNYQGKGSFRDFYLENSNGLFDVTTTVTVWVTVPNTYAYYSSNTKWTEFAYEAIQAADDIVNFSQFEKNGSNLFGVTIIHQGMGQETSGNPSDIWSHQGELSSYKASIASRTFDGVVLNSYSMQPEIFLPGIITGMGVITHEFGHLLGLPDYYDTDYEESGGNFDGTGSWDLMAFGSYNGSYNPLTPFALDAASPAHNNPLSKEYLNWLSPLVLNSAQHITLNPVISSQTVYKIKTSTANEYFYLENRQQSGFDAALPGHGMLVYHVDSAWIDSHSSSNNINAGSHQGIYAKVAAGTSVNGGGTPFPGAGHVLNITDSSTPNLNTWLGVPLNKSITNVVEDQFGAVSFDFMSIQSGSPQLFTSTNYNATTNVINWTPSASTTHVLIAYNTTPTIGNPINGETYSLGQTLTGGGTLIYSGSANGFTHSGLDSNTTYYYKIWSNNSLTYSPPLYTQVFTQVPITQFPWLDPIDTVWDNWNSTWNDGTYIEWEPYVYDGDATIVSIYQNNIGSASAILKSKPIITSPGKDYILSFKHIQPKYLTDQDSLTVLVKSVLSDSWTALKTFKSDIPNWNYQDINIPSFTEPFQIGFKGNCDYGNGIAIDSVSIYEGAIIMPNNYTIVVKNGLSPIVGAEVTFMNTKVVTNSSGEAAFTNVLPTRNWELVSIAKSGYEILVDKIQISSIFTHTFNLIQSEAIAPTSFGVNVDYKAISLEWNPVFDESFEGYTPWETLGINGWTLLDFDKGISGSYSQINYPNEDSESSFVVFDGTYGGIGNSFVPNTGSQMAVAFYSSNPPNNDWMISPKSLIADGDYLEFFAKTADDKFGLETMRVLISESTIDTSAFVALHLNSLQVPNVWTKFTFDLSSYKGKKIYFALQCNSNDKYALLLDDIKVKNSNVTSYIPQTPMSDSFQSNPNEFGNIEYQILRNGFVTKVSNGFSETTYSEEIPSCTDINYSIQTNYLSPLKRSLAVNNVQVSTCRVVTIEVTESGNSIEGATVVFGGQTKQTNSYGIASFDKILDESHSLSISLNGFNSINETISVVSDTVIVRALTHLTSIPSQPFNNIKVGPNPSSGKITITNIDLPIPFNYSLYTLDGSYLFSGIVDKFGESEIDLNLPANGTYLLKLFVGDSVYTHKIVVFK